MGGTERNRDRKTTLTKHGIKKKNNKTYTVRTVYGQNIKEPKLSKVGFPLYAGHELSLSNCYFELKQ